MDEREKNQKVYKEEKNKKRVINPGDSLELLDDFYDVFLINMRDLGSPVHSKKLMKNVLEEFPDKARIVIVLCLCCI